RFALLPSKTSFEKTGQTEAVCPTFSKGALCLYHEVHFLQLDGYWLASRWRCSAGLLAHRMRALTLRRPHSSLSAIRPSETGRAIAPTLSKISKFQPARRSPR